MQWTTGVLLAGNSELLAEKESGFPSVKTEKPLTTRVLWS